MKKMLVFGMAVVMTAGVLTGCETKENVASEQTEEINKGSEKDDAIASYQEILKSAPAIEGEHEELMNAGFGYEENIELFGNHFDYFTVQDLNEDGVPELVATSIVNFRWAPISIYTFDGEKAVLLKSNNPNDVHGTFEQSSIANGAYVTYICEDNHIHSVWRGSNPMGESEEENNAYIIDGVTLVEVECDASENENSIVISDLYKTNTTENINDILK